jgi:RNA polymerase sigma factor for flagellar operon FliA
MARFDRFLWLVDTELARARRRRYRLDFDDMRQVALLGLHQADQRASADLDGAPFEFFARRRIRGAILDELRSMGGARRDRHKTQNNRVKTGRADMARDAGLLPRVAWRDFLPGEELSDRTSEDLILVATDPSPEDQAIASVHGERMWAKIHTLPPRMRGVLLRRLRGEPEGAIAEELGVSEARVNQIAWEAARALLGVRTLSWRQSQALLRKTPAATLT